MEQEISKTTELQKTDKESNKQLQNLQLEQSKTMELIQQAVTHEQWKIIEETIYYQVSLGAYFGDILALLKSLMLQILHVYLNFKHDVRIK